MRSRALGLRRMRVRAGALLVATVLGGGLVGTGEAWADTAVLGVATADSGGIDVHLFDPDALWVQVTVLASTDPGATVLYQSDAITSYSDTRGWYTDAPIQLPGDAGYGDYPVDVAYRLTAGTVQHWSSDATDEFHYVGHAAVTAASFDRTSTDLYDRTATLSGTVAVFDPKTGTTGAPPAGTGVDIRWLQDTGSGWQPGSATGQTLADGTFSTPVTPGGELVAVTVQASQLPAGTAADAPRGVDGLSVSVTETRVVAAPAKVRVHAGQAFTVSGTVQRLTPSGWVAAAAVPVVTVDDGTFAVRGSGTSDANGHFSYPVTINASTSFDTYPAPSPYVSGGGAQGRVSVPTAGTLGSVSWAIDPYREVTARGHLYGTCPLEPVQLQYSPNGRSSWVRIGSAMATYTTNARRCSYKVQGLGAVAGYYRVVHPETDHMLAITSPVHRLSRIATRFVSFSISPTTASRNAALTATGRVQQYVRGAWHGFVNARVVLVFRPKGDSNWYWVVKGYTGSQGRFRLTGKAYGTGDWGVYYQPDASHFYSQTPSRQVKVS